jgi:hypothetical protein
VKKLAFNYTNHLNNEDALENLNESITEYDILCRDWTYTLIKKYLGEPHFKFVDIRFNNGRETNLYFAPRVFMVEETKEFIEEYTQFGIREKLKVLGHDMEGDYNSGKCKICAFEIGWSRRKVQFTKPNMDKFDDMTCNEFLIKKLLE